MKTFLDMTDDEIKFIVERIYQTIENEKVTEITRNEYFIDVRMEAFSEGERLNDDDYFELYQHRISACSFGIDDNEVVNNNRLYQKYLFAKGYHWVDKDNEFMKG